MTAAPNINQARLKVEYENKLRNELKNTIQLKNIHEVPRLEKIVLNVGFGKGKDDKRLIEVVNTTLTKISGQKPIQTSAKKSIAGFKLREGNKIGMKVTLRDERMYEFLDRFVNIVLPRLRDFHGLSLKSFDGQGNYSVGIKDQTVFPEISFEDAPITHGLQVVFMINTKSSEHSKILLEKLGMPFEKVERKENE